MSDRIYEKNGSKIYMKGKNNLLGVMNYLKMSLLNGPLKKKVMKKMKIIIS